MAESERRREVRGRTVVVCGRVMVAEGGACPSSLDRNPNAWFARSFKLNLDSSRRTVKRYAAVFQKR